jgi:hypothetical protein
MFCPKCGQPVAHKMRFCSRCQFSLDIVTSLILSNGILSTSFLEGLKGKHSPRWQGVRQGTILVFFGTLLSIVFSMLHDKIGFPEIFGMLSVVVFVVGGLLRMLYARVFEEGAVNKKTAAAQIATNSQVVSDLYLQPEQSIPVSNYQTSALNQASKVPLRPSSVTEETTTLLKDKHKEIS